MLVGAVACALVSIWSLRVPMEPSGNLFDLLPVAWKLQDPSLYPRDAFVSIFQQTPTFFFEVAALLIDPNGDASGFTRWGGPATALAYGFGAAILLLGFGVRGWRIALLTPALGGLGEALVGSNYLLTAQPGPTTMVVPALLAALGLAAAGHFRTAFLLCGASANLHILNSLYAGVMMLCGVLPQLRHARLRKPFAQALGLGLLSALPVLWRWHGNATPTAPATPEWTTLLLDSHRIHFIIASQPTLLLLKTIGVWLGAIALAWVLRRAASPATHALRAQAGIALPEAPPASASNDTLRVPEFVLGALGGALALIAIGDLLLVSVLNVPFALRIQPLRAASWIFPLAVAICATAWQRAMPDPARPHANDIADPEHARDDITRLSVVGLGLLLYFNWMRPFQSLTGQLFTPALLAWGLLAAAWAVSGLRRVGPPQSARILRALLAGIGAWPVYLVLILLALPLEEQIPVLVALASPTTFWAFCAVAAGAAWVRYSRASRQSAGAAIAATPSPLPDACSPGRCVGVLACIMAIAIVGPVIARASRGEPQWTFPPGSTSWREAAEWLRRNTPKDSLVQGPPHRDSLRTLARRSTYFQIDDDGALFLDPAFLDVYRARAQSLNVTPRKYSRVHWNPDTVKWAKLRREVGLDYVVLPADAHPIAGAKTSYGNDAWRIYDLSPLDAAGT